MLNWARSEENSDEEEQNEAREWEDEQQELVGIYRLHLNQDGESHYESQKAENLARVRQAQTKQRLKQAKKLSKIKEEKWGKYMFKLTPELLVSIDNKETEREEWSKHFCARQNKRYWRHKMTGLTRYNRPYINPDVLNPDDSTDESSAHNSADEYTIQSSGSELSPHTYSTKGSWDSRDRSDSSYAIRNRNKEDRPKSRTKNKKKKSSRSSVRNGNESLDSECSDTDSDRSSSADNESEADSRDSRSHSHDNDSSNSHGDSRNKSKGSERDSASHSQTADDEPLSEGTPRSRSSVNDVNDRNTAPPEIDRSKRSKGKGRGRLRDRGVWEEKFSKQYSMPYWRNTHTKTVLWTEPNPEVG